LTPAPYEQKRISRDWALASDQCGSIGVGVQTVDGVDFRPPSGSRRR
jgi:hypothetical protein